MIRQWLRQLWRWFRYRPRHGVIDLTKRADIRVERKYD